MHVSVDDDNLLVYQVKLYLDSAFVANFALETSSDVCTFNFRDEWAYAITGEDYQVGGL